MSSPSKFIDSQDEEEMSVEPVVSADRYAPLVGVSPHRTESVKGVPLNSDSMKAPALQDSPSPARRGVKTTPKAHLRHDDSQIQFAAIESSPLQLEAAESQYLTDRQKEVRERQGREAAAMFPDIRSSPRDTSRPKDYILPKLDFTSTQNAAPKSAIDEDIIPTYTPDAFMNGFLGSSPTPSSKRSNDRRFDDDPPPSSPPSIPSHIEFNDLAGAPLAHEINTPVHAIANAEEYPGNGFADRSLPSTKDCPSNDESPVEGASWPVHDRENASSLNLPQAPENVHPVSDFDIYVDAPSVPLLDKSYTEQTDNRNNDVIDSFRSEGSSQSSLDTDQINAQLNIEIERASSQPSAEQDKKVQLARREPKKRKRSADSPDVNKKKKRTPASPDLQVAAEVPGTGETVADCVMINVREVDRSRSVLPQQIKRELSVSPSFFTSTIEETPLAEKTHVGYLRSPKASQSLGQEQETPMMAKKAIGRLRGSCYNKVSREEAERERASALRKSTRVLERLCESTTASPNVSPTASKEPTNEGPWLPLGKTPARGMFRWLQRSSATSGDLGTLKPTASSTNESNAEATEEQSRVQDSPRHNLSAADHNPAHRITMHDEEHEVVTTQIDGEAQIKAMGVRESKADTPTTQEILQTFQSMLNNIKRVTFGPEEERAVVGILFESVKEVHEAGRRHVSM